MSIGLTPACAKARCAAPEAAATATPAAAAFRTPRRDTSFRWSWGCPRPHVQPIIAALPLLIARSLSFRSSHPIAAGGATPAWRAVGARAAEKRSGSGAAELLLSRVTTLRSRRGMSRVAYVNGRYVPHREAAVHIEDRGYQFADGIYEVTMVRNGRLVDEHLHLARLA